MTLPSTPARPKLRSTALVRLRKDGTGAVHDASSGQALEVARDQATLLPLIDGSRSIAELVEAHYLAHGNVHFAALQDLLRSLTSRGLLEGTTVQKVLPGRTWLSRLHLGLFRVRAPVLGPLGVVFTLLLCGAAAAYAGAPAAEISAYDVLWAWAGASLSLTCSRWAQAALLSLLGAPATHLELSVTVIAASLGPDPKSVALLNRPGRAAVYLSSLLASALVVVASRPLSLGAAFGASAVLICDLCPFAPTAMGKLLATLAGRVDLREHARAYLDRRILRRFTQSSTFEGEGSLIVSSLLSLAWLGVLVRLLLTRGMVGVLLLLAEAVDAEGAQKAIAYLGAGALALLIPLSVAGLFAAVLRAVLSLRPPHSAVKGRPASATSGAAALSAIPLFSSIPKDRLDEMARAGQELSYSEGDIIVAQGDAGDRFFAVLSGAVSVEHEEPSGHRATVAQLSAGDCFGELALLSGGVRTATVRATAPTTLLALSRDAFDKVRATLPEDHISAVLRASAALKKSAFFGSLPTDRLSALALKLRPRELQRDDIVIREGDQGHAFFLVADGQLEVTSEDGSVASQLRPGDHFGEVALLRSVPRTATVRAQTRSIVLELDKAAFLKAIAEDLSLSTNLETFAAERA